MKAKRFFCLTLISFTLLSPPHSKAEETISKALSPILEYLTDIASQHQQNSSEPVPIIAIGGCPGVGKTYLTQFLLSSLQAKGVKCFALPLDHFNLPLEERKKIGSTWDYRHLKIIELHHFLAETCHGKKILEKPIYDQMTGEMGSELVDLTNINLVLFEGLYALCSESPLNFFDYCRGGIFIEAKESDIVKWRWEREQKRTHPRTDEELKKHIAALLEEFHQRIAYSKKNATFVIKKDSSHGYIIENNSQAPSIADHLFEKEAA